MLLRRTQLRRTSLLKRLAALPPVNPERKAKLFAKQFGEGGRYAAWIRSRPCAACGRRDTLQAHHVRSRGAGGTWSDLVPLCSEHHAFAHAHGSRALELWWNINLEELAAMHVQIAMEERVL